MRVVAALFAVAALASVAGSGAAAQTLQCGAVVTSDVTLEASLTGCSTGLVVGADGVTIDLNGFSIEGVGAGGGSGIDVSLRSNVTIKNGRIRGFRSGIRCYESPGIQIEGNYLLGNNSGVSMSFCRAASIVNNVASGNSSLGIDFFYGDGRVEGNSANGNGLDGIRSWNHHGEFIKNVTNSNGGSGLTIYDDILEHGPLHSITSHVANANGGYGITASSYGETYGDIVLPGVIDGGKNRANANGAASQCFGVVCK
jgi:hypothetical protein